MHAFVVFCLLVETATSSLIINYNIYTNHNLTIFPFQCTCMSDESDLAFQKCTNMTFIKH